MSTVAQTAIDRLDSLAKPLGSLGRLEDLAVRLAAACIPLARPACSVMSEMATLAEVLEGAAP
ncbi:MAG: nicotinate-nucleotide--dimethylbenzimidazole phosphoribosyltransferase [Proteobacteria bacterium]|nr:nicotinate-nucleotide--dimethylbenzimidazole phosphoribosyltransferase [Pseudomonadota bacterium]MCP4916356.1 nicotinate-nucleotide--dimethylbenzimidazole phosphoribosyltransferase [Pseudomonadota bacterium]